MTSPQSDHEASTCIWCGLAFDEAATHLQRRTRCSSCGALTTDPRPSEAELTEAYGDWYRPHAERRFLFAADAILGHTRGLLAARIDGVAPAGAVLDVGAGDGTLIDALRARGREATGLERNIERADFQDISLTEVDGRFAAIVFWHSLEHLPDPGDAIREAARLLVPGGLVVVAVPNIDSYQADLFGDRWLHLDFPRHLVHLSTGSLVSGLEKEGFAIDRVSFVRSGQILIGWLQGIVGSLPGRPDLYHALRRERARGVHQSAAKRAFAIAAGVLLSPIAALAAGGEIAAHRAGTVYIEARLP
jgi:SAM-dependent methyltransferase